MLGGQVGLLLHPRQEFGECLGQGRRRPVVPRCLFGPPDPVETEKLFQEEMLRERERFQRKWGMDLDLLEAEVKKSSPAQQDERIPAVEERLASTSDDEDSLKESTTILTREVCRKPCSKFQKRVRVAGRLKRQTYLTEFWRSRRSLAFVFGKGKKVRGMGVRLQVTEVEVLEAPATD